MSYLSGWYHQIIRGVNITGMGGQYHRNIHMKADGKALSEITKLIEAEKIRPIIDKVFPFEQTNEALSYVESGRSKGKVVVKVK